MKAFISILFVLSFSQSWASSDPDEKIKIIFPKIVHQSLHNQFLERFQVKKVSEENVLIETDRGTLPWISMLVHQNFKTCGGFTTYFDHSEALKDFQHKPTFAPTFLSPNLYQVDSLQVVKEAIAEAREYDIRSFIQKLSSFHNRYYDSQNGVNSMNVIKDQWESLVAARSDAKVELFQHDRWLQPSVILTIEGSTEPENVVVVGGHGDSIAGFWQRQSAKAPGADDNASGISTITEIVRVLSETNYAPKKTLKFMAYAAEEVGLLGSKEIAKSFKRAGKNVQGVLQLDMTNYKGSNKDIVLISDFTSQAQNQFIGQLINTYLPELTWTYDKCGYACSDHASWHNEGFPASIPFEATKNTMNKNIHTANDTISKSGGNANHALKFAKLGLAFVIELDQ